MMQYYQTQIAKTPVILRCWENGLISLHCGLERFPFIVNNEAIGMRAIITKYEISIGDEEFDYDVFYDYRNIPNLLSWLIAQELIMPEFEERKLNEY